MTQNPSSDIEPPHPLVDDPSGQAESDILPRLAGRLGSQRASDASESSAPRRPPRVSKTIVNFVVDASLLVLVVSLLFTAAVLRFVFPAPSTSAGWTLWGRGYDAWANFQFALVSVLGLAILLHVMLHWSWVCGVIVTKLLRRSGAEEHSGRRPANLVGRWHADRRREYPWLTDRAGVPDDPKSWAHRNLSIAQGATRGRRPGSGLQKADAAGDRQQAGQHHAPGGDGEQTAPAG